MKQEALTQIKQLLTDATTEENVGNRSDLLDRYNAEPYGDEVKGRSKFVSSDVADAVEAILPDILDVFTSQEDLAEFIPVGPEDEEAAKQETDVVSHMFWEKNPGFENLYVWVKEALIQQNSYIWRGWVEKERVTVEEYDDLTYDELLAVVADLEGEYEFQEQYGFDVIKDNGEEIPVPKIGDDGQPVPISVKIKCVKKSKEYVIEPFPNEDFFGTPRWGRLGLDGIPCCGRRHRDKRIEDYIALGFDKASVETLTQAQDDEATSARHHTRDLEETEADDNLEVYEAYLNIDIDDDGVIELVRVWCSRDGTKILKWADGSDAVDEVGSIPINALTPYLMPHRHIGRSTAEQVDDIQQVKSVLLRQTLDSIYATNYARPYFDENYAGENTYDDLINPVQGAPVRTGGAEINWFTPQPVAGATLPLLDVFDNLKEMRVGATRYNQGLDADSLNKTASGISQIMNASQKKVKLVARTIAETALKGLFLGIHRDLRSGPVKEMVMKLRGVWVQVNPTSWRDRSDMTVSVGTGRGNREELRQGLLLMIQGQEKLQGSRLVDEQKLYNTIAKLASTYGIRSIDPYINNPATMPPPQPQPEQPDPVMIAAVAQAKKVEADHQLAMAKLQAEHAQKMQQLAIQAAQEERQQAKTASDIQTDEERLDLEKQKAVMDDDFKRDKLEIDALTGLMRDTQKVVTSEPPMSYEQVTQN